MFGKDKSYQTSATRIILALLVGAVVGAVFNAGQYLIGLYEIHGSDHFAQYALSKGFRVFTVAFVIWFLGILFLGGPIWLGIHHLGYRRWTHATAIGALIPSIFIFVISTGFLTGAKGGNFSSYANGGQQWENGVLTSFGWKIAASSALQFAFVGLIVSASIWFIAYKRTNSTPSG